MKHISMKLKELIINDYWQYFLIKISSSSLLIPAHEFGAHLQDTNVLNMHSLFEED